MELDEFVMQFADQFDDTDPSEITAETVFHDLDEWSSMTALSVLNMVEKKCGVGLSFDELKRSVTVVDVFNMVLSKK